MQHAQMYVKVRDNEGVRSYHTHEKYKSTNKSYEFVNWSTEHMSQEAQDINDVNPFVHKLDIGSFNTY